MDEATIESEVRAALAAVPEYVRPRAEVVHGFTVEEVGVEPTPNPFAPSIIEWRVTVTLRVPVVYSYSNFVTGPPDRTNLEELRAAVAACLVGRPLVENPTIARWDVSPDDYPAPSRNDPTDDLEWTVTACIDIG